MTDFAIAREYLDAVDVEFLGYNLMGGRWISRWDSSSRASKTKELDGLLLSDIIRFMDDWAEFAPKADHDELRSVAKAKLVLLAVKGLA